MLKTRPRLANRRDIIEGLATTILAQSAPRAFAASAGVANEGLSEVSVFAWQDAVTVGASVDFWTAQLGMVETDHLPASVRVIVKWSDVCLRRALHSHLSSAMRAIAGYYRIHVRSDSSNSQAYVHGESRLSATLALVCSRASIGSIAVVDVSSCGLSSPDWADIIPLLKQSYRTVVCVDYAIPELIELNLDCQDSADRASRSGLMACDRWMVASDDLLSPDPIVSYEQRARRYTAYVSELINAYSSAGVSLRMQPLCRSWGTTG